MTNLSPMFLIGEIKIYTISDASVMNLGNNWPQNFQSHKKQNQGFGTITGDHNTIEDIRSLLNDPDFIDTFTDTNEGGLPSWMQTLLEEYAGVNQKDEPEESEENKEKEEESDS